MRGDIRHENGGEEENAHLGVSRAQVEVKLANVCVDTCVIRGALELTQDWSWGLTACNKHPIHRSREKHDTTDLKIASCHTWQKY
jgi:hypothetical protein